MNPSPKPGSIASDAAVASPVPASRSNDDKRLAEAVALYLSTDGFSRAAIDTHARKRRRDLLNNADAIEEKEAIRRLNSRTLEVEYQRLAAHAAPNTHMDVATLTNILCNADQWPFWLLTVAKKIEERS